MMELTGIFKEIEEHTFTADKCFLCGRTLNIDNETFVRIIEQYAGLVAKQIRKID